MEFNSDKGKKKEYSSTKVISKELEILSLSSLEGTPSTSQGKRLRKLPSLSLSITKEKVKLDRVSFDIKDDYDIIETLGMGTYAYVRKATNKKTGQTVAIKTSRGNTSMSMLKSEFNLLKRLSDDNIVKVYDYIENKSKCESYMIMEYFEGVTLEEYVSENGVFTEEDSKAIIVQIISSIQYLHELGIAHRDIKPENILINDEKTIKMIDFNISKSFMSQSISCENKFKSVFFTQICSPLYCAPELKEQVGYNESIDIWGVGTVLFTMLFNSFSSYSLGRTKTVVERSDQIREIISKQVSISDEWRAFILSLFEVNPNDRPTAQEALDFGWIC